LDDRYQSLALPVKCNTVGFLGNFYFTATRLMQQCSKYIELVLGILVYVMNCQLNEALHEWNFLMHLLETAPQLTTHSDLLFCDGLIRN